MDRRMLMIADTTARAILARRPMRPRLWYFVIGVVCVDGMVYMVWYGITPLFSHLERIARVYTSSIYLLY